MNSEKVEEIKNRLQIIQKRLSKAESAIRDWGSTGPNRRELLVDVGVAMVAVGHLKMDFMTPNQPDGQKEEILARIQSYLGNGGLFNPELMEHDKVGKLILDIRDYLSPPNQPPAQNSGLNECPHCHCGDQPQKPDEWRVGTHPPAKFYEGHYPWVQNIEGANSNVLVHSPTREIAQQAATRIVAAVNFCIGANLENPTKQLVEIIIEAEKYCGKIQQLQSQLEEAKKYAEHLPNCSLRRIDYPSSCTCGLDALKAKLKV